MIIQVHPHTYYLSIIGNKKNTLNSIIKNLPTICHFLFQSIVLQYTLSRIHRPKIKNKIFIYLLFKFLLDTDPEQFPDPWGSGCLAGSRWTLHYKYQVISYSCHFECLGQRSSTVYSYSSCAFTFERAPSTSHIVLYRGQPVAILFGTEVS